MFLNLLGLMASGFLLGLQHSLDPDHVAAVSTLVSENRSLKRSALAGAVWGLGHTAILLVAGVALMFLKIAIPETVAQALEFMVGLMLLYLGGGLLKKIVIDKIHLHKHSHGDLKHAHLHSHKTSSRHEHLHKPFFVGVVHGLAGSAGIMLLIMATMSSVAQGFFFTFVFGIGSILGMMVSGALIGLPFRATAKFKRLNISFMILAAVITITIGLNVIRENWMWILWKN
jgi:ABC-type nickel/cobalt efflux system permease component RcnA